MNSKEKGIMNLIKQDRVLNTKCTYDEFYGQNTATPPENEDDLLEEAFLTYLETCGKQTL